MEDLGLQEYKEIPVCEKLNLTVKEAIEYSGIGRNRIYNLLKNPDCKFKLQVGRKILIKRKPFEKYLESINLI